MIIVSRSLIRELKTVLSRGLGITSRQTGPPVEFLVDQHDLRIRTQNQQIAMEYRLPAAGLENQHIVAPFGLLRCCHGTKSDPVQIQGQEKTIQAEWQDAGIPQSIEYPEVECEGFPELPDQLEQNESRLMVALGDACETATTDSARYALNHIQFSGARGQIVVTDGRQLLVQSGFQFPWDGDLLVPANRLLISNDLGYSKSVEVGSDGKWLMLRSRNWTIWLKINTDARFPDIKDQFSSIAGTVATLSITDGDAEFLKTALKPRPYTSEESDNVTLDLNGSITVRSREEGQERQCEYIQNRSKRSGEVIRINSNRNYLTRALRLGFRNVYLSGADSPASCTDEFRTYVWALFTQAGALVSQSDAVRIESRSMNAKAPRSRAKHGSNSSMTTAQTDSKRISSETEQTCDPSPDQVLTQMRSLCGNLTETLSQTRELMSVLREQSQDWNRTTSTKYSCKPAEV